MRASTSDFTSVADATGVVEVGTGFARVAALEGITPTANNATNAAANAVATRRIVGRDRLLGSRRLRIGERYLGDEASHLLGPHMMLFLCSRNDIAVILPSDASSCGLRKLL